MAYSYLQGDNRFKVEGWTYPVDLLDPTAKYGGNYVMFRINVHQDSYLVKDNRGQGFFAPGELPPSKRGEVAGLSSNQIQAGAAVQATLTAAGGAKALATGDTASAVSSVAVGVGVTGIANVAFQGNFKREYKTQKLAVALYMPGDLSVKYGASWEETSLDTVSQAIGAGTAVMNAISSASIQPLAGEGASAITAAVLNAPGMGQMAAKSTGTAANPKKEQLFKNVDYRTFTFSYQFAPRSEAEAIAVRNILKQFKLHMHPEFRDAGNFLYIYPSEFDIVYYSNGQENTSLHKHTSCVLTDLSISYAPQGTFTSFNNGMPTQINVQMTFKELAILTKKDIDAGY